MISCPTRIGGAVQSARFTRTGRWVCNVALLMAVTLVSISAAVAQNAVPGVAQVKPASGIWTSGAGFSFGLNKKKELKTRQSLSGIACNLNAQQQRICLMAFDEGAEARYATVNDLAITPDDETVVLRNTQGELDAEAAATDGRYFYVTGSHSAKRGDCASNPDSRHVIRLRIDPATGRAVNPTGSGPLADYADSGRLWTILQAQPAFAPHIGERACLGSEPPANAPSLQGRQGVNIEGMAVKNDRLYFGFRGPVVDGVASVLSVDAKALFEGGDARPELTRLALGSQRGIRDMLAVKGGLLLLAGPDDSPASQGGEWTVWWWSGQSAAATPGTGAPQALATLDVSQVALRKCDKELKPEAMTLLDETADRWTLLVLSDGMCDGGALTVNVPR